MQKQKRRITQDPALTKLGRTFSKLPWMLDLEYDLPEKTKHINKFPGSAYYSVRFTFRGHIQQLAYAYEPRLVDLCRFADALTLQLWKYRLRGAPTPDDSHFNYSLEDALADIFDWEERQPEYLDLMYGIENHLVTAGWVTSPADLHKNWEAGHKHTKRARRTAAGLIASEVELIRGTIADGHEKYMGGLNFLAGRLDRLCAHLGFSDAPAAWQPAVLPPIKSVVVPPPAQDRPEPQDIIKGTPGNVRICRCDTPRPIWLFDHRLCTVCGCKYIAGKSPAGNFANAPATWSFLRDQYCPECSGQLVSDGKITHCLSDSPQGRRLEHNTGSSCGYKILLNETPGADVNTTT